MSYRVPVLCLLALLAFVGAALAAEPPVPAPVPSQPAQAPAVTPAPADPGLAAIFGIPEPEMKSCSSNCWDAYWPCARGCASGDTNCARECGNVRNCCLAACNPGELCGGL
ncbi:MAG: hypothetical protein QOF89_1650 [Acidobacteriota bacterium]|jgi:hypothetical protein|nr:hypothetical protein [Acidobacteriota bacterium]